MNTCDATDVAVIIPAYNEQGAIGKTISAIRQLLPFARIFVCDNNCTDLTASEAEQNGATVIYEAKKGKGNAVRRLLQYVEADIYIMVDGDNTYDLCELPAALEEFSQKHYDLMTGNRMGVKNTYMRLGHGLGNKMFRAVTRKLLGVQTNDVFSGLRIMSKRLVRSFPVISLEFEIETELSVFAARMNLPVKDFPTSAGLIESLVMSPIPS